MAAAAKTATSAQNKIFRLFVDKFTTLNSFFVLFHGNKLTQSSAKVK
jgi:hypothetical protein